MNAIRTIIEGKELIYEDENNIVRFSMADGQMQKTVTYKKDWYTNRMQPVKKGEVIQETGTDAMLEFLMAREYLENFKLKEPNREVSEEEINENEAAFYRLIQSAMEGRELVYEDENDIVRFSMADGQMQRTVTYKKDWYTDGMQPVKKGEMIQETGTDAILKLISAGENLEHFKLLEKRKKITPEDIGRVIIDEKQSAENIKPNTYPTGKIDGSETSRDGN